MRAAYWKGDDLHAVTRYVDLDERMLNIHCVLAHMV